MSARLNQNPIRYFAWKGKTFFQVTSAIQKNVATIPISGNNSRNLFISRPLKLFRREIASIKAIPCNMRTSIKIDELNRPNGYLVYNNNNQFGLDTTLDFNLTTNKSQLSSAQCSTTTNCFNQAQYARRRVRSSGMIPKKFNAAKNNDQYYTSTSQYLNSRNMSFQQNQYNFIRQGDQTQKPGSAMAVNNLYSANGLNHCNVYYISAAKGNNTFSYKWIDAGTNVVTIPDGYYDVNSLNGAFRVIMTTNNHYYINIANSAKVFLLNIVYNTSANNIQLQSFISLPYYNSPLVYSVPAGVTWNTAPNSTVNPIFIISNNFTPVIGFTSQNYPTVSTGSNYYVNSNTTVGIQPTYVGVYYKPNNAQYAKQGAVDSSARITRKIYDTLTTVGAKLRTPQGSVITNTLAYRVPTSTFAYIKDSGKPFPVKLTPKINKYNGQLIKCQK